MEHFTGQHVDRSLPWMVSLQHDTSHNAEWAGPEPTHVRQALEHSRGWQVAHAGWGWPLFTTMRYFEKTDPCQ